MSHPSSLDELAAAILDDTPVDWDALPELVAGSDPKLLDQLKTLAVMRQAARMREVADDAPPAMWGHLRVLELVGRGAFGKVYRAWDTRLDREVALKLLGPDPDDIATSSSVIEEGRLLARVQHRNVATIYGAERVGGQTGLWMEFIHGRTLEEAVRAGVPFSTSDLTRIGIDLCGAVAAVHAAGLLHRDVKPQNVMMDGDGRVVLMDFGTGRERRTANSASVTGTPLYLAPEVLAGGAASVASDVYSIGVLLFRLLTGAHPIEAATLADLQVAHAKRAGGAVPSAHALPAALRSIVARALHPDAACRYASAEALGAALTRAARGPLYRRPAFLAASAAVVLTLAAAAWSGTALSPSAPVADPMIAVLPFTNLSSEADSDYFVDGLTSEVIRQLATIEGLSVRSQTSSFSFKGKPRDLGDVKARLGVNLVVEADVLRVDDRLRINAQLVRVDDDVPLWSEQFDRRIGDVFSVQQEISGAIVKRLRLSIGVGRRQYRTNANTYDAYLRARTIVDRFGTDNGRTAARLFEQVIAVDPEFAPAHAGLADAYAAMSWQLTGLTNAGGLEGMRPAAERALELDPMLAEAHAAMGIVWSREQNWTRASESFERALALGPGLAQIATSYAFTTLTPTGQFQKAEALLRTAMVADPLAPLLRRELGWMQFTAGRYEEAVATFLDVHEIDPEAAAQGLARALNFAGRPDEAIAIYQSRPVSDGDWERWITSAYVRAGRQADVDRIVAAHRNEHPFRQALVYAALGDKERTLEALDRALPLAPHRTALLLVYPEMSLLRGDPRVAPLRQRLNLPWAPR